MGPATGRRRGAKPGTDATAKVTLRLPAGLVRRAKHYAVDADLDLQDVVAQALAEFLAQRPRPGRPVKRP